MLKAEKYLDPEALRKWVHQWDESLYIDYFNHQISDRMKRFKVRSSMEENIVKIKTLCGNMGDQLPFAEFMGLMNRIIFNCYFKQGESALRLGNFYEEILVPADQTTRNRMFDYRDERFHIGELTMEYGGEAIGHLGEQSDIFRLIFDVCFAAEDTMFNEAENLMIPPAPPPFLLAAQEEGLITLKIWKSDTLGLDMDRFVDLFLYHCSTRLGLNFKRARFEAPPEPGLFALKETLDFRPFEAEAMPLMYFNSAAHNLPPQMIFMAYYNVLDYFFERAKHRMIYQQMQRLYRHEDLDTPQHFADMAQTVQSLSRNLQESDYLFLVLERVLEPEAFMQWLDEDSVRKRWFTHFQEKPRELPILRVTSQQDLLRSLVQRIYTVKSSLCEAHLPQDEKTDLPRFSHHLLQQEISLLKYFAAATLEIWSQQAPTV